MRPLSALALGLSLACVAPAAGAQAVSQQIATEGLAATAARLSALPDPAPGDRFALGGVLFLRGVERALQLRWQTALRADWSELPILRLPIPDNPSPRPLAPQDITTLFFDAAADMAAAQAALAPLESGGTFTVDIRLADLWFDIDMNGTRGEGEGLMQVAGAMLGRPALEADPVVRFDTADAAWLAAYSHLLAGVSEVVLAFDPAPAVARVQAATQALAVLQADSPPPNAFDMMFGRQVDRVAIILHALKQDPDPARIKAAARHFGAMIGHNRRFWSLLAAETDNALEWVPNDAQTSALGVTLPPGTGDRWQAVLADAEAILDGRLLIPHWRMGGAAGFNLARYVQDPGPIDVLAVIQGEGLLRWSEPGPRASMASWNEFARLLQGDAVLFALLLN